MDGGCWWSFHATGTRRSKEAWTPMTGASQVHLHSGAPTRRKRGKSSKSGRTMTIYYDERSGAFTTDLRCPADLTFESEVPELGFVTITASNANGMKFPDGMRAKCADEPPSPAGVCRDGAVWVTAHRPGDSSTASVSRAASPEPRVGVRNTSPNGERPAQTCSR